LQPVPITGQIVTKLKNYY